MRRLPRLAVFVACALLLAGCAAQSTDESLPPRPTGAEREKAIVEQHANNWKWMGEHFQDVELPEVELQALLSGSEWRETIRRCFTGLGFPDVVVEGGYAYLDGQAASYEEDAARFAAMYECSGQYPEPDMVQHVMSEEEISFLYDYYKNVLSPCVRSAGYPVEPMPERAAYVRREQYWSPYEALYMGEWDRHDELIYENLLLRCPEAPRGWYER